MLIQKSDYERINNIIRSVIKNENADPSVSCIFFSVYGAYILEEHFNIKAVPKAGLALFHTGENNDIITFGEKRNGKLTGEFDAFHAWIEAEGWIIDFMAPEFPDIKNIPKNIPAKIFQKPIKEMANTISDLKVSGDFYLESTLNSTSKHFQILKTSLAYSDLAKICSYWFKKSPELINDSFPIADQNGKQQIITLAGNKITGVW